MDPNPKTEHDGSAAHAQAASEGDPPEADDANGASTADAMPEPSPADASAARSRRPIWEIADEIGRSVPDEVWEKVPGDLSKNYRHYLYGTPKTDD